MALRTVKLRFFNYTRVLDHPTDPNLQRYVGATASRGDELEFDDLLPRDQERAELLDVFAAEGEFVALRPGTEEVTGITDLSSETATATVEEMSVQDLTNWISGDEPTINDLLEYIGDDKELAQRVLEAENAATGNEPRKGLVQGISQIMSED